MEAAAPLAAGVATMHAATGRYDPTPAWKRLRTVHSGGDRIGSEPGSAPEKNQNQDQRHRQHAGQLQQWHTIHRLPAYPPVKPVYPNQIHPNSDKLQQRVAAMTDSIYPTSGVAFSPAILYLYLVHAREYLRARVQATALPFLLAAPSHAATSSYSQSGTSPQDPFHAELTQIQTTSSATTARTAMISTISYPMYPVFGSSQVSKAVLSTFLEFPSAASRAYAQYCDLLHDMSRDPTIFREIYEKVVSQVPNMSLYEYSGVVTALVEKSTAKPLQQISEYVKYLAGAIKTVSVPRLLRHIGNARAIGRNGQLAAGPHWRAALVGRRTGYTTLASSLLGSHRFRSLGGPLRRVIPPALWARHLSPLKGLWAHLAPVYCVALDPLGTRLFTGSDDCLVKVWSTVTGQLLASCRGHLREITDIAVSPDGTVVASADTSGIVRLWDFEGRPLAAIKAGRGDVLRVAFSSADLWTANCRFLITASVDGSLNVYNLMDPSAPLTPANTAPHDPPIDAESLLNLCRISEASTQSELDSAYQTVSSSFLTRVLVPSNLERFSHGHPLVDEDDGTSAQRLRKLDHLLAESLSRVHSVVQHEGPDRVCEQLDHVPKSIYEARANRLRINCRPVLRFENVKKRITVEQFERFVKDASLGNPPGMLPVENLTLSMSPCGTRIATGGNDGLTRIFDLRTMSTVAELPGSHATQITLGWRTPAFVSRVLAHQALPDAVSHVPPRMFSDPESDAERSNPVQISIPVTGHAAQGDEQEEDPAAIAERRALYCTMVSIDRTTWGEIQQTQFSPDGQRLVTVDNAKNIRVWLIVNIKEWLTQRVLPSQLAGELRKQYCQGVQSRCFLLHELSAVDVYLSAKSVSIPSVQPGVYRDLESAFQQQHSQTSTRYNACDVLASALGFENTAHLFRSEPGRPYEQSLPNITGLPLGHLSNLGRSSTRIDLKEQDLIGDTSCQWSSDGRRLYITAGQVVRVYEPVLPSDPNLPDYIHKCLAEEAEILAGSGIVTEESNRAPSQETSAAALRNMRLAALGKLRPPADPAVVVERPPEGSFTDGYNSVNLPALSKLDVKVNRRAQAVYSMPAIPQSFQVLPLHPLITLPVVATSDCVPAPILDSPQVIDTPSVTVERQTNSPRVSLTTAASPSASAARWQDAARDKKEFVVLTSPHPSHPDILFVATSAGVLTLWDTSTGICIRRHREAPMKESIDIARAAAGRPQFQTLLDAPFTPVEATWAADGSRIVVASEWGRVVVLGFGPKDPFIASPSQQYYFNDFLPLRLLPDGTVVDQATGLQPHFVQRVLATADALPYPVQPESLSRNEILAPRWDIPASVAVPEIPVNSLSNDPDISTNASDLSCDLFNLPDEMVTSLEPTHISSRSSNHLPHLSWGGASPLPKPMRRPLTDLLGHALEWEKLRLRHEAALQLATSEADSKFIAEVAHQACINHQFHRDFHTDPPTITHTPAASPWALVESDPGDSASATATTFGRILPPPPMFGLGSELDFTGSQPRLSFITTRSNLHAARLRCTKATLESTQEQLTQWDVFTHAGTNYDDANSLRVSSEGENFQFWKDHLSANVITAIELSRPSEHALEACVSSLPFAWSSWPDAKLQSLISSAAFGNTVSAPSPDSTIEPGASNSNPLASVPEVPPGVEGPEFSSLSAIGRAALARWTAQMSRLNRPDDVTQQQAHTRLYETGVVFDAEDEIYLDTSIRPPSIDRLFSTARPRLPTAGANKESIADIIGVMTRASVSAPRRRGRPPKNPESKPCAESAMLVSKLAGALAGSRGVAILGPWSLPYLQLALERHFLSRPGLLLRPWLSRVMSQHLTERAHWLSQLTSAIQQRTTIRLDDITIEKWAQYVPAVWRKSDEYAFYSIPGDLATRSRFYDQRSQHHRHRQLIDEDEGTHQSTEEPSGVQKETTLEIADMQSRDSSTMALHRAAGYLQGNRQVVVPSDDDGLDSLDWANGVLSSAITINGTDPQQECAEELDVYYSVSDLDLGDVDAAYTSIPETTAMDRSSCHLEISIRALDALASRAATLSLKGVLPADETRAETEDAMPSPAKPKSSLRRSRRLVDDEDEEECREADGRSTWGRGYSMAESSPYGASSGAPSAEGGGEASDSEIEVDTAEREKMLERIRLPNGYVRVLVDESGQVQRRRKGRPRKTEFFVDVPENDPRVDQYLGIRVVSGTRTDTLHRSGPKATLSSFNANMVGLRNPLSGERPGEGRISELDYVYDDEIDEYEAAQIAAAARASRRQAIRYGIPLEDDRRRVEPEEEGDESEESEESDESEDETETDLDEDEEEVMGRRSRRPQRGSGTGRRGRPPSKRSTQEEHPRRHARRGRPPKGRPSRHRRRLDSDDDDDDEFDESEVSDGGSDDGFDSSQLPDDMSDGEVRMTSRRGRPIKRVRRDALDEEEDISDDFGYEDEELDEGEYRRRPSREPSIGRKRGRPPKKTTSSSMARGGSSASSSSKRRPTDEYVMEKAQDWLTRVVSLFGTYTPQLDDEVVFCAQGYGRVLQEHPYLSSGHAISTEDDESITSQRPSKDAFIIEGMPMLPELARFPPLLQCRVTSIDYRLLSPAEYQQCADLGVNLRVIAILTLQPMQAIEINEAPIFAAPPTYELLSEIPKPALGSVGIPRLASTKLAGYFAGRKDAGVPSPVDFGSIQPFQVAHVPVDTADYLVLASSVKQALGTEVVHHAPGLSDHVSESMNTHPVPLLGTVVVMWNPNENAYYPGRVVHIEPSDCLSLTSVDIESADGPKLRIRRQASAWESVHVLWDLDRDWISLSQEIDAHRSYCAKKSAYERLMSAIARRQNLVERRIHGENMIQTLKTKIESGELTSDSSTSLALQTEVSNEMKVASTQSTRVGSRSSHRQSHSGRSNNRGRARNARSHRRIDDDDDDEGLFEDDWEEDSEAESHGELEESPRNLLEEAEAELADWTDDLKDIECRLQKLDRVIQAATTAFRALGGEFQADGATPVEPQATETWAKIQNDYDTHLIDILSPWEIEVVSEWCDVAVQAPTASERRAWTALASSKSAGERLREVEGGLSNEVKALGGSAAGPLPVEVLPLSPHRRLVPFPVALLRFEDFPVDPEADREALNSECPLPGEWPGTQHSDFREELDASSRKQAAAFWSQEMDISVACSFARRPEPDAPLASLPFATCYIPADLVVSEKSPFASHVVVERICAPSEVDGGKSQFLSRRTRCILLASLVQSAILSDPQNAPFLFPVPLEFADYRHIVAYPSEVSRIIRRIVLNYYRSVPAFFHDVASISAACTIYNMEGSEIVETSRKLVRTILLFVVNTLGENECTGNGRLQLPVEARPRNQLPANLRRLGAVDVKLAYPPNVIAAAVEPLLAWLEQELGATNTLHFNQQ